MSQRPQYLDLKGARPGDRQQLPSRPSYHLDLPSPRVGEIPPALSPLDAFALHSRALAKKLEEGSKDGRRMSRLPHHEIADELAKRPDYFRTISGGSGGSERTMEDLDEEDDEDEEPEQRQVQVSAAPNRPISQYPMLGSVTLDRDAPRTGLQQRWLNRAGGENPGYFGIEVPRASSPEPFDPTAARTERMSPALPSLTSSIDSIQSSQPRTLTNESSSSSRRPEQTLAPPRSPMHPRSARSIASIKSILADDEHEDGASNAGSFELLPPRKSSRSRPHSPLSPTFMPGTRSPSATSQFSADDLRRPSFNFSRPRSSSGTRLAFESRPSSETRPSYDARPSLDCQPTIELPSHHESDTKSSDTPERTTLSRQDSDRGPETPGIFSDTDYLSGEESGTAPNTPGVPSYIYAKYSLPRGRIIDRESAENRASWANNQFKWEEGAKEERSSTVDHTAILATIPQIDIPPYIPQPYTPSQRSSSHYSNRSRSVDHRSLPIPRPYHRSIPSSPSITTLSTERTMPTRSHVRNSPSQDIASLSPEEHLEKGIESHSTGSLSKSTYHLRLAARGGSPTGMLLYALACRHGWGMRPNQSEGVVWLKRAADSSSLEFMASDSNNPTALETLGEQKARKAQFALAIYELGMSYMNGWGIPKDKPLAVRCFEIAGSWGDCDALAEAGFCYTQGVGCKKDLKKAAGFYRKAAEGGMSMAGNSWIYKPKYMDEASVEANPIAIAPSTPGSSEKNKPQSRSRARSIFSRKKPVVT